MPDYVVRRDRRLSQKAAAKRRSSVNQAAEGGDATPSGSGLAGRRDRRRSPSTPEQGDPRTAAARGQSEGESEGRFDMSGLRSAVLAIVDEPDISWRLGTLLTSYSSINLSSEGEPGGGFSFHSLSHMVAE